METFKSLREASEWKKIEHGFGEASDFEGYGWTIYGETYPLPHQPKYYVDISDELAEALLAEAHDGGWAPDNSYIITKFLNEYRLGFFRVVDARKWCEKNRK